MKILPAPLEVRRPWWSRPSGVLLLLLVAWLTAAGRWGSYVGPPGEPVYISEIMLTLTVFAWLVEQRADPRAVAAPTRLQTFSVIALVALLVWAVVRLIGSWPVDLTALRDFAPYGYAVVAVLAATRVVPPRLLVGVLMAAIVFHTGWVTVSHFAFTSDSDLPQLGKAALFEVRNDFDATVCGTAVAWTVYLATVTRSHRTRLALLLLAILNIFLVLVLLSRAGLLATIAGSVVVGLASIRTARTWAQASLRNAAVLTVAILIGIALGVGVVAVSGTGARLASTFDLQENGEGAGGVQAAGGTSRARIEVHEKVTKYSFESAQRAAFGVGFGPDFLSNAGAAAVLEGEQFTGVRSPHDVLLNTLARLGLVGAALHIVVIGAGLAMGVRLMLGHERHPVTPFAVALAVSLPIASLLGVILESPFGAIPWYWAFGFLLAALGTVPEGHSPSAGQSAAPDRRSARDADPRAVPETLPK